MNQIHDTNLMKKGLRIKSAILILKVWTRESGFASLNLKDLDLQICIFKDSFCAIVLRICWIRENKRIFENWLDLWLTIQNKSFKVRIRDPLTIWIQDLFHKARIQPFWSQDLWPRYNTNPWIRKTNPCFYKSLIQFLHPKEK